METIIIKMYIFFFRMNVWNNYWDKEGLHIDFS